MATFELSKLSADGLEKDTDSLGGGFELLPSGIYTMEVQNVYLTVSAGGALGAKAELKVLEKSDSNPYIYRETFWITNKEGRQYFEKDGKKIPLPGFTHVRNMCLVCAGKPLDKMTSEEKIIKEYDYTVKQEIEKSVPVLVELKGRKFKAAILYTRSNKKKQNPDTKEWVETNEETFSNSLAKVLTMDDLTITEAATDKEPVFAAKWLDKNKGKVNDKFKPGKAAPTASAPVSETVDNAADWE